MLLGVELISRKLEVMSNGLAVRSVFSRRDIPFDQMESITIKVDDVEAPATEYAIMRSNAGGKIKFDSSMPGYRAALKLVAVAGQREVSRCRGGRRRPVVGGSTTLLRTFRPVFVARAWLILCEGQRIAGPGLSGWGGFPRALSVCMLFGFHIFRRAAWLCWEGSTCRRATTPGRLSQQGPTRRGNRDVRSWSRKTILVTLPGA